MYWSKIENFYKWPFQTKSSKICFWLNPFYVPKNCESLLVYPEVWWIQNQHDFRFIMCRKYELFKPEKLGTWFFSTGWRSNFDEKKRVKLRIYSLRSYGTSMRNNPTCLFARKFPMQIYFYKGQKIVKISEKTFAQFLDKKLLRKHFTTFWLEVPEKLSDSDGFGRSRKLWHFENFGNGKKIHGAVFFERVQTSGQNWTPTIIFFK